MEDSEIRTLMACMAIIREDVRGHGAAFFVRLLEKHPDWLEKFPAWRGSSMDQVKKSARLRAQGTSLFCDLEKWLISLDDMDVFRDLVSRSGRVHMALQIDVTYFEQLDEVLIGLLRERLGQRFTDEMANAWRAFWPLILDGMRPGM